MSSHVWTVHKLDSSYLAKTTVKYIQGTVILIVVHIVNKIFHLELYTVSFIIFATFKLLIAIFFGQPLKERIETDNVNCL